MAKKQMIGTAEGDRVQQVKVDLAACLRMAVLDDFHEGIDNHFTVGSRVPRAATSSS